MLDYYYVKIGCFHDYNRIMLEMEQEELKNDFCWFDNPLNTLKGFRFIIYKLINSQRMNRIVHMPFRKACTKYLIDEKYIKEHSGDRRVCFIITSLNYKDGLIFDNIKYLKAHFPDCKTVFFFSDKVEYYSSLYRHFDLDRIKSVFDCTYTYNEYDADRYHLLMSPYLLYDFSRYNKWKIKYDAFFVGQDKCRLLELVGLAKRMVALGLKISFNIIGEKKEDQISCEGISYCSYIPYKKVLRMVSESKAIVNILQPGANGVTLRDCEAISMNKILITDKSRMLATDFYTEDKIIDLKCVEKELYKIIDFDRESPWNNVSKYTISNYYKCLSEELNSQIKDSC